MQTDTERQSISTDETNFQSLLFETGSSTHDFQRSVYNVLDYVGDVGGLLDGLKLIASTLIAPFSSYNFVTLLLTKLFRVQRSQNIRNNL